MELPFPQAPGLFVTATDTDIGKTLITGALARLWHEAGQKVAAFKPIATGCHLRDDELVSEDAEFLAYCLEGYPANEVICPVRYQLPLSPRAAEEAEGKPIDWSVIQQSYADLVHHHDLVLVEGIGGILVPLSPGYTVLDMIVDMGLPVLVVARAGLGTLNHTALTVAACRTAGVAIQGIVLNRSTPEAAAPAEVSNVRILREMTGLSNIAVVDYDNESRISPPQLGTKIREQLACLEWLRPAVREA